MKLFEVMVHYDSYERDLLAVCTTVNKAKKLCREKETELGDLTIDWHAGLIANSFVGNGTHRYTITPIDTNKRLDGK